METHTPQKLYAYVDESGQDTLGELFLVSVVVTGEARDGLRKKLRTIERVSGNARDLDEKHAKEKKGMESELERKARAAFSKGDRSP